ncbi:hypothetical protein B0H34DRAFT_480189 [Crassisporium funariophilum]|nr:hypothetical protein B0H34DRAFT_480189 [Crassisporium funariophilum]
MRSKFPFFPALMLLCLLVVATPFSGAVAQSSPPTPPESLYLTHFTERDPRPSFGWRVYRVVLKEVRRIQSACRFIGVLVVPPERPVKENIFHARVLEDAKFLSNREVPSIIGISESRTTRENLNETNDGGDLEDAFIRDIVQSVESRLEGRTALERRRILDNMEGMFKRFSEDS